MVESAVTEALIGERLALLSMNVSSKCSWSGVAPPTLTRSHAPEGVMIEGAPVRTCRHNSPPGGSGDKKG